MSALAERTTTNGRPPVAVVEEPRPRTLDAYGRLEALCDPGSLHVIRSTVSGEGVRSSAAARIRSVAAVLTSITVR